jgi:hypothetical protein
MMIRPEAVSYHGNKGGQWKYASVVKRDFSSGTVDIKVQK